MKILKEKLRKIIGLKTYEQTAYASLPNTTIYFIVVLSSFVFLSCSSQKKVIGNYTYKTECLGLAMDGSQLVKAWGNGRNKHDAIEQAEKNAIRDVLFKGVYEGKQECEKRPVVAEVNAQQKYESYFIDFFSNQGAYRSFVSLNDKLESFKGANKGVTYSIVVLVQRAELKQKMIKDGIIK